jgi:hypothetical protein
MKVVQELNIATSSNNINTKDFDEFSITIHNATYEYAELQ